MLRLLYMAYFLVNCPVGSYHDVNLKRCVSCPRGTFQNKEAQTNCTTCPQFTSTSEGNKVAKSIEECKGTFTLNQYMFFVLMFQINPISNLYSNTN